MSRVLAELLGAHEMTFRMQIQRLEQAAGLPGADIRLAVQVVNETRDKIHQLGLDPKDTTGPELFRALEARLRADETRVRESLGIEADAKPAAILEAVKHYLERLPLDKNAFVVKQSAMRQILKKLQPKATMKKLGYRSMDSMLKHEPVAQLMAATSILESREWHRHRLEAYKKLTAGDFETKKISFYVPTAKNWPDLSAKHVATQKHNILPITELGAVVLLPLEEELAALTITTLLLAINNINDIRSQSSFLKLHQVRHDFGNVVYDAMLREPMTEAELAGERLPWKMVQWFYGHGHSTYQPDAFEPHVQPEDLQWYEAEEVLSKLNPTLEFWEGSRLLALLDAGQPISLNMLDVALGVCNGLDYSNRIVHHMRSGLSRELMARYLHQENLQALLAGKLSQQLVPEPLFDA